MDQTVFLAGAGEEQMACFTNAAGQAGNKVFTVYTDKSEGDGCLWNKSSPISARTAVLQAVSALGTVGHAILVFDTASYAGTYDRLTVENISHGIDDMISGYMYLTADILKRFADQDSGTLTFVLCSSQTPAGPITAAAEAAFEAFAERIAAGASKKGAVTLVRTGTATKEETAAWLYGYLELPGAAKAALNPKTAVHWIKTGGKPPLNLLGR